MKKSKRGLSLLEVVFSLGIASLIVVAIVSLSTVSVRNATFSKNNSVAARYMQEATEWLRQERDAGWGLFNTQTLAAGTNAICITESPPIGSWTNTGVCGPGEVITGTIFTRQAAFSCFFYDVVAGTTTPAACGDPTVNQIEVEVAVMWVDGQGDHTVRNSTRFTDWRR